MADLRLEACRRKPAYKTKRNARKAVKLRYSGSASTPLLCVYECDFCGNWHKTSRRGDGSFPVWTEEEFTTGFISDFPDVPDVPVERVGPVPTVAHLQSRLTALNAIVKAQRATLFDQQKWIEARDRVIRELRAKVGKAQDKLAVLNQKVRDTADDRRQIPQMQRLRKFVDIVRGAVPADLLKQVWAEVDREGMTDD